ncbi:protein FAR1-RELATED SEQUENCE 6-like isoform X3 [Iris pallida]|uniref:Protein FAR1-RELATED SEQUENCE n=1 Tax=Iris pallida TaxID=29817 RepID=A0AAX6DJT0_IRIPA|nr:protein FAR1-RELATED SEQUENCE 6-like isoform X3 [Iris pallida]KAJ6793554.1 protein FAR1-RELATED SEQUENCE 6-like isoform X3 [Iris pallida]
MADNSVTDEKLDERNEISVTRNNVFVDDQYNEVRLNVSSAIGDEVSQKFMADSVDKRPMVEERKEATIDVENCDEKKEPEEQHGDRKLHGGNDRTPQIGMIFKSYEEVVNFYKRYALRVGFGVAVKKSSFTTRGLCRRLVLMCTRGGKGRANECYQSRPTAKTNCPSLIVAKLWGDGLLHLMEVNLEHNHAVSPSAARFLKCYKRMSTGMAKDLVVRASQHENLSPDDKEFISYVEGGRLKLGRADVEALHQFFSQKQAKNPNFFYLMDLDVEGHLRNVFWADARSRAAYRYFNDVIAFDTSYVKDKYKTPLALFIGVNHHGQLVLLGCGLLSEESVENYIWLLKTWLTCMQGGSPDAVITNECKTIQCVNEVFSRARHRICLWNVMKDIREKLRGYAAYSKIMKALEKLIFNSFKVDIFEEEWRKLTNEYELEGNQWLTSLYDIRHLWVPAFLKNTFWAGMSISQCNESVDAFFEGFIYSDTSVKDFLGKYELALQSKHEIEAKADSGTFHGSQFTVCKFHMEEQLSKLYTPSMFKRFQDELKATGCCHVSLVKVDGSLSTFRVMDDGDKTEYEDYEVVYNVDGVQGQCECGMFQFSGILCRHTLAVFKVNQVYEIPSHYILDRWRKDFKQLHALSCKPKDMMVNNILERYDNLSLQCLQLVDFGIISDEKYQLALKLIIEMESSLLDDNLFRDLKSRLLSDENMSNESDEMTQLGFFEGNKTPSVPPKRRGRPPKKTKEPNIETVSSSLALIQDPLRPQLVGTQHDVLQAAATTSQLGTDIRMHGRVDLMEEVNPNELSFGEHFGIHSNHQHIGNHSGMQPSNTIQFGQQPVENQNRVQWYYQQMLQDDQPYIRRIG